MKLFKSLSDSQLATILQDGGIGIIRTDTLYGVIADANNSGAVKRVYDLKDRTETKSPIVLVSEQSQLFDVVTESQQKLLSSVWPGPVSVILPSLHAPEWIRRGNGSVAYRMPSKEALLSLISRTGPLIAPSANPEASEPARSVEEAIKYFGDKVDFYVDEGIVVDTTPSRILRVLDDGSTERLR